jgi:hypothetical protein
MVLTRHPPILLSDSFKMYPSFGLLSSLKQSKEYLLISKNSKKVTLCFMWSIESKLLRNSIKSVVNPLKSSSFRIIRNSNFASKSSSRRVNLFLKF